MHHIVYRDTLGGTRSFELGARPEATLGRGTERDLVLEGRQVSRHHASIERISESYLLRDLGSANGTFLNGLRLSGTSAIALRDGDVIEIGSHRLCFAADVELARSSLEPVADEPGGHAETVHPFADLLRDGIAWVREHEGEPDETSAEVLSSFNGRSLSAGIASTLELLKERLRVDVAAAFVRRRSRADLELVAARPDSSRGEQLAKTFDLAAGAELPRLFHQADRRAQPQNLFETCTEQPEHSAALVPFFRGESHVGVLAVERLRGPRIDRKLAAVVAVYGERVSRALALRLASPNDTAFDLGGGAA